MHQITYLLLVIVTSMFGAVSTVHAEVINQNEWENKTVVPWGYVNSSFGTPPFIDFATPSPSGSGAITFTFPSGSGTTSFGPGVAFHESLSLPDMYTGFWMRYSPGFVFHPIGTKILYQYGSIISPTLNNLPYMAIYVDSSEVCCRVSIGIQGHGGFSAIPHDVKQNVASVSLTPGVWKWMEVHVKKNTPSQPDGILEIWIDDVLTHSYSNITYFDNNSVWKTVKHSPEYGGGGSYTIPATQFMYVDHTVISTTRIGHPTVGRDTTAPARPTNLVVN